MNSIKNTKKVISAILVASLSIFCFSLNGRAETITVQNGHSHVVTGYATEINQEYKVDIFWASDMTFVFDRGKYNSKYGTLSRASSVEGAEMDSENGDINCWYGFDGIKNRVIVLNRSNMDICAKYASEVYENVCGENVKLQLYDYAKNDNYNVEISQQIENVGYPEDFDEANDREYRFGSGEKLDSETEKIIKASPADGTMYANKVFLNITGTPIDTFQKYELVDNTVKTADMGCITITLKKATD